MSLYDEKCVRRFISQLKHLQNDLGKINDLRVARELDLRSGGTGHSQNRYRARRPSSARLASAVLGRQRAGSATEPGTTVSHGAVLAGSERLASSRRQTLPLSKRKTGTASRVSLRELLQMQY